MTWSPPWPFLAALQSQPQNRTLFMGQRRPGALTADNWQHRVSLRKDAPRSQESPQSSPAGV